jgi:DNA adenine methylase
MILRRLGNKQRIAKEIQKNFPEHKIYIEPFFGAGGMFFNKPKAKHNIVNDLDSDVFNLFQVVINQKEELEKAFYIMPIHQDLLNYWKINKEVDPIKKALRFLFLSNFTFLGKQDCLSYSSNASVNATKDKFNTLLSETYKLIYDVPFNNTDFKKFLKDISFPTDGRNNEGKTLIYCDPPYLNTVDKYEMDGWNEDDSNDLFDCLKQSKCMFAMSEFNHPFIIEQAEKRGLNVVIIGERNNLKNRRIEILVTNYKNRQGSLFA